MDLQLFDQPDQQWPSGYQPTEEELCVEALLAGIGQLVPEEQEIAEVAEIVEPRFRGAAAEIQQIRCQTEAMIAGPFQTGKTFACLYLVDTLLRQYDGATGAVIRRIRADMETTCLPTLRDVMEIRGGVKVFGGKVPKWFEYPNGSILYVAGLDYPGKILSGQLDVAFVNQPEQLTLDAWETLSSRTTGRAGNFIDQDGVPFGILLGDPNPGPFNHWIKHRQGLRLLQSYHRDNPALYDDHGNLTPHGAVTMEQLGRLTGMRRARGLLGEWMSAEGLVLDQWSGNENVSEEAEYESGAGPVYWFCDDGYAGAKDDHGDFLPHSHPRVFLLAQRRADGIVRVFYESFEVGMFEREQLNQMFGFDPENPQREFSPLLPGYDYPRPEWVAVPQEASKIKRLLHERNVRYHNGTGPVEPSVVELNEWLAPDHNGVRRVLVHPRCYYLCSDMVNYVRNERTHQIVKDKDNGPDALRYGIRVLTRH